MKKVFSVLCVVGFLIVMLPGAARAQFFSGKIGLKAYGGLNFLGGGDINSGQEGWAGFYNAVLGIFGYTGEGEYKPANLGLNFGGEFIYQFNSSMGIGLGASLLQASKTSEIDFDPGLILANPIVYTAETQLSAIPLKLSFYYFLPSSGMISLNVHAGLGYYLARGLARQEIRDVVSGFWTEDEYDVKGGGLGFHGGLGAEFKLGPRIALFLEAQGRYAAFVNFEGDLNSSDETGWSDSDSGKMWSFKLDLGSLGALDVFEISNTEPTGSGISDVHRTKADFSGFSFVVGFIIRL